MQGETLSRYEQLMNELLEFLVTEYAGAGKSDQIRVLLRQWRSLDETVRAQTQTGSRQQTAVESALMQMLYQPKRPKPSLARGFTGADLLDQLRCRERSPLETFLNLTRS